MDPVRDDFFISPDRLWAFIHDNRLVAFRQFGKAFSLSPGEISSRALNSRISAGLKSLLKDRPEWIGTAKCLLRLLSDEQIGVLWDSEINQGPMPLDDVANLLAAEWSSLTPNEALDVYFMKGNDGAFAHGIRSPNQQCAHLMLVSWLQSQFPTACRWCSIKLPDALGPAMRVACESADCRTDVYAPVVEPWHSGNERASVKSKLAEMELYATRPGSRLLVLCPKLTNNVWPSFLLRENRNDEIITNRPWTAWEENLSYGWG